MSDQACFGAYIRGQAAAERDCHTCPQFTPCSTIAEHRIQIRMLIGAIESMRMAGGSDEFQAMFDRAKRVSAEVAAAYGIKVCDAPV